MSKHLSCYASGSINLQGHVCLLKDTPVLMLHTIFKQTGELFILLVCWVAYTGTICHVLFSIRCNTLSIKNGRLPSHHNTIQLVTQSLGVSLTTIAKCTVDLLTLYTTSVILNTTICGVSDLSVMKCSSFFDLLANEIECVHGSYS